MAIKIRAGALARLWLTALCLLMVATQLQAQIRPGYDLSGMEEPTPEARRQVIPSYSKFQPMLETLCFAIWNDGRYDSFTKMLDAHIVKDPECPGCRPLFSTMLAACKAQRAKKLKEIEAENKKELKRLKAEQAKQAEAEAAAEGDKKPKAKRKEEPTPTPAPPVLPTATAIPKQRDPGPEVLAAASHCFDAIFDEEKSRPESYVAVKKLTSVLSAPEDKTPAEKEYYTVLTEFIFAPFLEYERSLPRDTSEALDFDTFAPDASGADTSVDDFFGQ